MKNSVNITPWLFFLIIHYKDFEKNRIKKAYRKDEDSFDLFPIVLFPNRLIANRYSELDR